MIKQLDNILWLKTNALTRYIFIHTLSGILPLYIVNEYPKSGGTWIAEMLSEILDVPFPRNQLPAIRSSIVHGHYMHKWNLHNTLLVWRDGRDVLISQYYHWLFENDSNNRLLVKKVREELRFKDYSDITNNLVEFMNYVYIRKKYPSISWSEFVDKWSKNKNFVHVFYEEMRRSPVYELSRIVSELTGKQTDKKSIQNIVDKYSFINRTGRYPGTEDKYSFARKGVIGDWKNYFNAEARRRFHELAGRQLINLGYEKGDTWVHESIGHDVIS